MFSAGSTMNAGSKKLQREVASTFCGAQGTISGAETVPEMYTSTPQPECMRIPKAAFFIVATQQSPWRAASTTPAA
jgi:hypothetical protein